MGIGLIASIDATKALNEIKKLKTTVAGKADTTHTHSEFASIETEIAGKAVVDHTHAATAITEDPTHRWVTDAEKAKWNNNTLLFVVLNSTAKDAIVGMNEGSRCIVKDDGDGKFAGYWWDGSSWIKDSDPDWANVSVDWSAILNKPSFVLQTDVGTLSNLNTTDKTSLVNAINEVKALVGSGGGASVHTLSYAGQLANSTVNIAVSENSLISVTYVGPETSNTVSDGTSNSQTFTTALSATLVAGTGAMKLAAFAISPAAYKSIAGVTYNA